MTSIFIDTQTSSSSSSQMAPTQQKDSSMHGRLVVGYRPAYESLSFLLGRQPFVVELDPSVTNNEDYVFGKDHRVTLLNGTHLLPFPIAGGNHLIANVFRSLLPCEYEYFIKGTRDFFGFGFEPSANAQAIRTAKDKKIPYKQAATCIENGNCFLRDKTAIVGYSSVLLSFIALYQQKYFDAHTEELEMLISETEGEDLDPDLVRRAKNFAVYQEQIIKNEEKKEEKVSKKSSIRNRLQEARELLAEPTEEEMIQYAKQARTLEAMLRLTINKMASELDFDEQNVAIVHQTRFHIDKELTLGPDGTVLLHDEREALKLLSTRNEERCSTFIHAATQRLELCDAINDVNTTILASIGCKAIRIAGVFENELEEINFINGFLLNDKDRYIFVTNGVRFDSLFYKEWFLEALKKAYPNMRLDVLFVLDADNAFEIQFMQDFMSSSKGGINCLTWTY